MDNRFEELLFKYRFYLLGVLLGIILILAGFVAATKHLPIFEQDKVEILGTQEGDDDAGGSRITVEISGAVEKPGVYAIERGKRVEDALVLAGGLSAAADRAWVSRTLNRAAKLSDGQKIFIPQVDKFRSTPGAGFDSPGVDVSVNGLIDINTASQSALEELSGIGPATAKKIIDGRPYSTVEELLSRKILSKKIFEENKDKLSIY